MSYYHNSATVTSAVTAVAFKITKQRDVLDGDESTSTQTFVDSTLTFTVPNRPGGRFIVSFLSVISNSGTHDMRGVIDGVSTGDFISISMTGISGGSGNVQTQTFHGDLNGDVVKMQWASGAGEALTMLGTDSDNMSWGEILEIGGV